MINEYHRVDHLLTLLFIYSCVNFTRTHYQHLQTQPHTRLHDPIPTIHCYSVASDENLINRISTSTTKSKLLN